MRRKDRIGIVRIMMTSIIIAICAMISGCAQSKSIQAHSRDNYPCHQNFIEPTPIRMLYENSEIGSFSPLIIFGSAKSEIHPLAQPTLDSIAKFLKTASTKYYVVVHSDKNGPKDRVFSLSEQRAKSIVAYLKMKGISEERLKPIGAGWKCFLGSERDPEDQKKNRRVEFILLNP